MKSSGINHEIMSKKEFTGFFANYIKEYEEEKELYDDYSFTQLYNQMDTDKDE